MIVLSQLRRVGQVYETTWDLDDRLDQLLSVKASTIQLFHQLTKLCKHQELHSKIKKNLLYQIPISQLTEKNMLSHHTQTLQIP